VGFELKEVNRKWQRKFMSELNHMLM